MAGFFETYVDDSPGGNGSWVSGDEKEALVKSGDSFTITAVTVDPGDKYGERFVLDIVLNGEERRIGFQTGTVDSRDRMLAAMAEYIGNSGSTVDASLTAAGRATLITAA